MKKTSKLLSFTATMAGAALVVPVLQTQTFAAEDEIQTAAVSNPGVAALAPIAESTNPKGDSQAYVIEATDNLETSRNELEAAEKQEANLSGQIKPVQTEADTRYATIMNEVQDAEKLIDQNDADYNQANKELDAVRQEQDAVQAEVSEAETKVQEANAALDEAQKAAGNLGDEDLKKAQDAVVDAQTGVDNANAAADQAQTDFSQADEALKNEQNLLDTSQENLAAAEKKDKELPGKIDEQLTRFEDQSNLARDEIEKHKDLIQQAQGDLYWAQDNLPYLESVVTNMEDTVQYAEDWLNSAVKDAETAKAEYDDALSALEKAEKALAELESKKDQSKQLYDQAQETVDKAWDTQQQALDNLTQLQYKLEDWQAEKEYLEMRLQEVKDQISQGSAGFFSSQISYDEYDYGAYQAYHIVSATDSSWQDYSDTDYSQYVHLGQEDDATSLENMKKAIDALNMVNEYRQLHNQTEGTDLSDLKVSHYLMAVAQYQMGYSQYNIDHVHAFWVGENLAWNYRNPYDGWYTKEKKLYDELKEAGKLDTEEDPGFSKYGHYLNIVDPYYEAMGYAYGSGTNAYGQTFAYDYGDAIPVAEYKDLFYTYYNQLQDELRAAQEALDAFDMDRGAELEKALQEAEEAYADAQERYSKANQNWWQTGDDYYAALDAYYEAENDKLNAELKAEWKNDNYTYYQKMADYAAEIKEEADKQLDEARTALTDQQDKVAALEKQIEDETAAVETMKAIQLALLKGEKTDLTVDNAVFQEWLAADSQIRELKAEQEQNKQDMAAYKQTISESTEKLPVLSAARETKNLALQAAKEAAQKAQKDLEDAAAEAKRVDKLVGDVHTAEAAAEAAGNQLKELEKQLETFPTAIEKLEEQIRKLDKEYDELTKVVKKKEAIENKQRGVFADVDKYLDLQDWLEEKNPQLEAAREKLTNAQNSYKAAYNKYTSALELLNKLFPAQGVVKTETAGAVTATWQASAFKEPAHLVVKNVASSDHTSALKASNVAVYDVYFENEKGERVEAAADKPILLSIAIPQGFAADKLAVHHQTDETWHAHTAETGNGKVTFTVSHNSLFALVDTRSATATVPGATAPKPDGNNTNSTSKPNGSNTNSTSKPNGSNTSSTSKPGGNKTDSSASNKPNTSKNDGKTNAGVTSVKPASSAGSAGNKTSTAGTGHTASNGKTSPNTAAVASSALPLDMLVLCCGTGLLGAFEAWRRKQNI